MYQLIYLFFCFLFIDFLERGRGKERERERNKHWFVGPLINTFIGCFLCVPWPVIEPPTLVCGHNAPTNWATWPGPGTFIFPFKFHIIHNSDRWILCVSLCYGQTSRKVERRNGPKIEPLSAPEPILVLPLIHHRRPWWCGYSYKARSHQESPWARCVRCSADPEMHGRNQGLPFHSRTMEISSQMARIPLTTSSSFPD